MSTKEQLIEQHIREYESRLKHIDELYQRAREAAEQLGDDQEVLSELKNYAELQREFKRHHENIKTIAPDKWRQETARGAGPMAIWDVLAQKLEDFVERHEK